MVKKILLVALSVFLFFTVSLAAPAAIVDRAQLFTDAQKSDLSEKLDLLRQKYNIDFAIITSSDTGGLSTVKYMDKSWEEGGYGSNGSGILLFINMQERELKMLTEGEGIKYISDTREESLYDSIIDGGMSDGDYYRASLSYIEKLTTLMESGMVVNQRIVKESVKSISILDGVISLLGALGVGTAFYKFEKEKYTMKTSPFRYDFQHNNITDFTVDLNDMVNSYTNTRRIVREEHFSSSDSGRTTTRSSSTGSGRTFGGGGSRKF